jgi:Ca2+-binding EF-hand superfamily protein
MRSLAMAAALLGLTASLPAQDDEALLRAAFTRMDADKDGKLVPKEFPGSDRQFAALDADKNGFATFAEYRASDVAKALLRARYRDKDEAHPRTTPAQLAPLRLLWLARADQNGDGKVTRAEWTGTDVAFLQLDRDGNGVLDKRDRAEAEAEAPPPAPALPEPKGAVPAPEDLLRRFDRDGDGRLADKELKDPWLRDALPWADCDGDGALSEQELRALLQAVLQRRQQRELDRARPQPYDVPFDAWDRDNDGMIRQNEWQGPLSLFQRIDLNLDAAVSRDELLRYRRRVLGADFIERFDLDGDGKVTFAEFAGPRAAFARADRSGDGAVTRTDR